jgi:hypothetical protein
LRHAAPRRRLSTRSLFYSSSRTLSSRTVSAIRVRFGSPRASDFASFAALLDGHRGWHRWLERIDGRLTA